MSLSYVRLLSTVVSLQSQQYSHHRGFLKTLMSRPYLTPMNPKYLDIKSMNTYFQNFLMVPCLSTKSYRLLATQMIEWSQYHIHDLVTLCTCMCVSYTCICLCLCMQIGVQAHVCVYVGKLEVDTGYFLIVLSLIWRTVVLTDSAKQMDSGIQESCLCPPHWDYSSTSPCQASYAVLGIWTKVLMFVPQAVYQLTYLPSTWPGNLKNATSQVPSQIALLESTIWKYPIVTNLHR